MKCIYCNKEIPDGSKYCPFCGAYLETPQYNAPSSGQQDIVSPKPLDAKEEITPENFRDLPTYKPRLRLMLIYSAIAFAAFLIALFGSLMVKIIGGGSNMTAGIIMLAFGLPVGIAFLAVALSLNKKVFPQVDRIKMKGIEILIPIFIAFGLACGITALVLQGVVLMVY